MRLRIVLAVCALAALPGGCFAQGWEWGAAGGFGFMNSLAVTNPLGSANTGFRPGAAVGAVLTQNLYPQLSGEIRYTYRMSDLDVSGFGQNARFRGMAHALHYDLLYHTKGERERVRPFIAAGGGMKLFRGTGQESAVQPLSDFALLTRTQQLQPMVSLGGGVRVRVSDRAHLRVEVRDYLTAFPSEVIAPAPGAKVSGWLHDIVPLVGLSFAF